MSRVFPFDGVVGQDDAKLALVLTAVDPRIGGVLLRGHKGSAKTTLARGLAALLGDAPFVELPLGATEDRVVGTLDTEAALTGGGFHFRPGLLAGAHGGVLYVDEINLLADHLVDTLLDVSVSGENLVERDGVSHRHPARFVLIGSMNPEEGELRPQLLDRFGFCVEMTAPDDIASRVEAMRRRLAFDAGADAPGGPDPSGGPDAPGGPDPSDAPGGPDAAVGPDATDRTAGRVAGARSAAIPDEVMEGAARLAVAVGAEGLRADLTLCRGAAALAGLDGRPAAGVADLRRVAPLALAHRSRRGPFDPPTLAPEDLRRALDRALGETEPPPPPERAPDQAAPPDGPHPGDRVGSDPAPADGSPGADDGPSRSADGAPGDGLTSGPEAAGSDGVSGGSGDAGPSGPGHEPAGGPPRPDGADEAGRDTPAAVPERPMSVGRARQAPTPAAEPVRSARGRYVRDVPADDRSGLTVAVAPTARALAGRRAVDPRAPLRPGDLRAEVRMAAKRRTIVLCVDLSGSMGAGERAEAATGTALGLLADAYQQRDRVALVGFRDTGADVLLGPTSSIEVARNRLDHLVTGGATPLAAGISTALHVAATARTAEADALLVVLTDGRATGGPQAVEAAMEAAAAVRRQRLAAIVFDCETGPVRLRLAERLAAAMGARHLEAGSLDPAHLTTSIRALPTA